MFKRFHHLVSISIFTLIGIGLFIGFMKFKEFADYKRILEHLAADSRVAEVLVTENRYDEASATVITTIKFLEYDVRNQPMKPKYFTFRGNRIQFQSLVVRFDESVLDQNHPFEGKSIYLFLKAFVLDGPRTQEFIITPIDEIPSGYEVPGLSTRIEKDIWKQFWEFVVRQDKKDTVGIKNAQIEAPGSVFLPGTLYSIKIEHDGGLRIDTQPIAPILRGEKLL
ncbi:MAG: hypothetical protein ACI9CF_000690 [Candidatus Omnitrophota bacterium]|jgi:hypothetical protein